MPSQTGKLICTTVAPSVLDSCTGDSRNRAFALSADDGGAVIVAARMLTKSSGGGAAGGSGAEGGLHTGVTSEQLSGHDTNKRVILSPTIPAGSHPSLHGKPVHCSQVYTSR